jgi:hypothetical protein
MSVQVVIVDHKTCKLFLREKTEELNDKEVGLWRTVIGA